MRGGWPEAVKTEMIRDKFVFGIHDNNLKECLLQETDISLSGLAQRTESSKQHIREMTGTTTKPMHAILENNKQKKIVGSVAMYTDLKNVQHLANNAPFCKSLSQQT